MTWDPGQLRQTLATRFSLEELRTLCQDLGVDYEDLPAMGKTGKARELISYLQRRDRLADLVEVINRKRPDISLSGERGHGGRESEAMSDADRQRLQRALAMARRSLSLLEEQAAGYTSLTIPAHLRIELEDKRREVDTLEKQLRG